MWEEAAGSNHSCTLNPVLRVPLCHEWALHLKTSHQKWFFSLWLWVKKFFLKSKQKAPRQSKGIAKALQGSNLSILFSLKTLGWGDHGRKSFSHQSGLDCGCQCRQSQFSICSSLGSVSLRGLKLLKILLKPHKLSWASCRSTPQISSGVSAHLEFFWPLDELWLNLSGTTGRESFSEIRVGCGMCSPAPLYRFQRYQRINPWKFMPFWYFCMNCLSCCTAEFWQKQSWNSMYREGINLVHRGQIFHHAAS